MFFKLERKFWTSETSVLRYLEVTDSYAICWGKMLTRVTLTNYSLFIIRCRFAAITKLQTQLMRV